MHLLAIACQLLIAAGLVNVWLLRHDRPSPWRPDGAANMKQEFERYGFPDWVRVAVRAAKLTLSALLVVGIWYPPVAAAAAAALALLMLVAILAHLRIGDPPRKSLPALGILLLCGLVVWANTTVQV